MRVLSLVALMCLVAGAAATQTLSLPEGQDRKSGV
jgi:hypothetical protein